MDGEWRKKTVAAESIPEETSQDRQDSAPKQEGQTPNERIRIEHASRGDTQAMPVPGETALETEGTGAARPSGRDERDPDDLPAAPPADPG
jgi:hypothetical protein